MANIFKTITEELIGAGHAIRNYNSITWFKRNIAKLLNNRSAKAKVNKMATPAIGKMFLMTYDAKHKDTLPYYDLYPLIFVVKLQTDGFIGLNLHYLAPAERAKLFNALIKVDTNNPKMDESTRLKLTYRLITRFSESRRAKVCVKKYLYSHVLNIGLIPPDEWVNSTFLPLEGFRRKNSRFSRVKVWNESSNKIKGQQ